MKFAELSRQLMTFLLLAALASPLQAAQALEQDQDSLIKPGKGMGPVLLGMNSAAVKESMGNIDFSYKLPGGMRVDGALWKEEGKASPVIRLFYGKDGKVAQIVEAAPALSTADGIKLNSKLSDALLIYKNLKELKLSDATKLAYFDDSAKGICLLVDKAGTGKTIKAIMVHKPGAKIIADTRPL